jgi:hypothetical protein
MRNLRRTGVPNEIQTELPNINLIIKVFIIIKSVFGKPVHSKSDSSFSILLLTAKLTTSKLHIPTALPFYSLHKVSRAFSRGGGLCFYCETSRGCHIATAGR